MGKNGEGNEINSALGQGWHALPLNTANDECWKYWPTNQCPYNKPQNYFPISGLSQMSRFSFLLPPYSPLSHFFSFCSLATSFSVGQRNFRVVLCRTQIFLESKCPPCSNFLSTVVSLGAVLSTTIFYRYKVLWTNYETEKRVLQYAPHFPAQPRFNWLNNYSFFQRWLTISRKQM